MKSVGNTALALNFLQKITFCIFIKEIIGLNPFCMIIFKNLCKVYLRNSTCDLCKVLNNYSFYLKCISTTKIAIPHYGKKKSNFPFLYRKLESSSHGRCGEKGAYVILLWIFLDLFLNQIGSVHTACCHESLCLACNASINFWAQNSSAC